MSLHLLDHRGRFVAGRQQFGGSVDDHVALLLLFDGYRGERCRLSHDRQYFMQTLVNTDPFGFQYRRGRNRNVNGGLLVFSAPVPPASGSRYRFSPSCDSEGTPTLDESALESFIDGLSYGSFLSGRPTWMDHDARSYGMVGVVFNGFHGRDAFRSGGTVGYFVVTGTRREDMARVLVHELGHSFELADEYEESSKHGCEATGSARFPNIVYRHAVEDPLNPNGMVSLDPGDVRIGEIPWGQFVGTPPPVIDHPLRPDWLAHHASGSTFGACSVGRYEDTGTSPQSRAGLWEGGHYRSFNAFRAEPFCIMRDEYYQVYDPDPPPPVPYSDTGVTLTFGEIEIETVGPPVTTPPCGPETRDPSEATRFRERVGNSFLPYCVACRHWIDYRFGEPDHSDIDDWAPGQSLHDRIGHFQGWLSRHR